MNCHKSSRKRRCCWPFPHILKTLNSNWHCFGWFSLLLQYILLTAFRQETSSNFICLYFISFSTSSQSSSVFSSHISSLHQLKAFLHLQRIVCFICRFLGRFFVVRLSSCCFAFEFVRRTQESSPLLHWTARVYVCVCACVAPAIEATQIRVRVV